MMRNSLARFALATGLASNAIAVLAQSPNNEPVVWERQGTIRTSAVEFTAPAKVAVPVHPTREQQPPTRPNSPSDGLISANHNIIRLGPTRASSVRNVFVPPYSPQRTWVGAVPPLPPSYAIECNAPCPANYIQPAHKETPPHDVIPTFAAPRPLPQSPLKTLPPATTPPQSAPISQVPCSPTTMNPSPTPTWHGHQYRVQPFPPPGAFPVLPTGEGYYSLLDRMRGEAADSPPRWPYPRNGLIQPPFSEISFTYLDAIDFEDRDWAEKLKRIPLGDHWLFSTGGEARYRYNMETNSRLSGRDNTYELARMRAYTDLWYEDRLRVYTEFLFGDTLNQDLPPLPRDVNRGDIQQLFVDVRLTQINDHPIFFRAGRQELYYGSQRLVSTVDWGNNRPRFDGFKLFYRSDKFDADLFLTRPVQVRFNELDPSDRNLTFAGAWLTYKPKKGTLVDAYYLNLEIDTPGVVRGQSRPGSANISTFGTRFYSRRDSGLLIDAEAMLQTGHWADQSILAHAYSAYAGWYFQNCWGTPTLWAGYDYASGDPDPNRTGRRQTFNQLFGFGHYYMGFADLVGRQNIHDFTVQGYLVPTNWIVAGIQYHVFRLDSSKDALYNAAGVPIRRSPTGAAGFDVGSEIDLVANLHLSDRQDIFMSYSHFFPGAFVRNTGPASGVDCVYAQYSWRW